MKKIMTVFVSVFIFFLASGFSGSFSIGGMFGYYSVMDSLYKNIYSSGNIMYGGFVSIGVMHRFELRGDVNYFKDSGKTSLTGENTNFSLVPVTVGVRVKIINENIFRPYLGAGVSLGFYNEKARIGDVTDTTVGFYIEGGNYFVIGESFHIDLYLRYINSNAKSFDETIKLGGINTGIGLGYTF
jgi:hypothetical protein